MKTVKAIQKTDKFIIVSQYRYWFLPNMVFERFEDTIMDPKTEYDFFPTDLPIFYETVEKAQEVIDTVIYND